MSTSVKYLLGHILTVCIPLGLAVPGPANLRGQGWILLTDDGKALSEWRKPAGAWFEAGDAKPDPKDAKRLLPVDGRGVLINGPSGKTRNLLSAAEFGDIEAHFEFMIPKGSNAGVKLQGLYEIQILDSHGKVKPTASDCGGIYPRAELLPKYHYLDQGIPPRVNAARPFGEWQTLDVVFQAPRFDADGKKTADARLLKVVLNGQVIHEDVALTTPTGHAWHNKEVARGPLLLQADHGPVAFRKIRVRPL